MLKRLRKMTLSMAVPLGLLTLAAVVKVEEPRVVHELTLKVFDSYQYYFPREYDPALPVRIIDIDDYSLATLGQWPWPRTVIADIVMRLRDMNAAVMGFDMVFSEPDRTSPARLAEAYSDVPQVLHVLKDLPDNDKAFAEALTTTYAVTGFILNTEPSHALPRRHYGFPLVEHAQDSSADELFDYVLELPYALTNRPELEQAAEGNGFFNATHDVDGVIRRVPTMLLRVPPESNQKPEIYFSLAMELLRVGQGARQYHVKLAGGDGDDWGVARSGIKTVRNGHYTIPTDENGNILIHFTEDQKERYISAADILDPAFDASRIEGHILIFGTSAPGLKDLRHTPLNPALPGVELHVQAIEQVLSERFLQRPYWINELELVLMVLVGVVLMIVMNKLTAIWGALFMVAAQAGGIGFSVYFFIEKGFLIDPIGPSLVILMLYLTESLRRYISSEAERKQVRAAFSQYMSPALVEELAKDPDKLTLGGEMKEMTVLFCDIRGFTTISEQFDAQGLTDFINRFLTPMTDVILQHHGTIDKYMGDCIMAFWNAPLDDPEHHRHAAQSALGMFVALRSLNAVREQRAKEDGRSFLPVNIGIGINGGEICVGNMGSAQRFDYSVLGDDVNLASRLEGQSKNYGVDIVVGENTAAHLADFALLELDLIQVKGKTSAVTIYALLGEEVLLYDKTYQELKSLWDKMLKAYRAQQWESALNYIGLCRKQALILNASASEHSERGSLENNALDRRVEADASPRESGILIMGLFDLYEERIARYKVTPPPEDWDGVFVAESK